MVRSNLSAWMSCLALLTVVVLVGGFNVAAQGSLCQITNVKVNPGQGVSVPAGQPFQFSVTLTGGCSPGTYTFRADITDTATSQIVATGLTQPLLQNGQFTVTLNESAVAPSVVGAWGLQVSTYVLMGGWVVSPNSQMSFQPQVIASAG